MKKAVAVFTLISMLAFTLVGCNGNDQHSSHSTSNGEEVSKPIQYSNITDSIVQEELTQILGDHGVSHERIETLFTWVGDYNDRVTAPELPKGFVPMDSELVDYSNLMLESKEQADGTYIPEVNCRLTAFLLMGDMVKTNGAYDNTDTYLMFDLEAIDTQEMYQMSEVDRKNFSTLFNWVPVSDNASLQEHIDQIQKAWTEREITIDGSQGLSLVTVYLHTTFDHARFVGHTGVLAQVEDGLMFIEKYGPNSPFQITVFENRDQLKNYLLARPDFYGDENELEPIIMENGTVME